MRKMTPERSTTPLHPDGTNPGNGKLKTPARRSVSPLLPEGADPGDGKWIEHLSSMYQVEFTLLTGAVAVGAVAPPLVVNFLISLPPTCVRENQSSCVSDAQLLAVPLVPLLIVMALGYVYLVARVVGKYT